MRLDVSPTLRAVNDAKLADPGWSNIPQLQDKLTVILRPSVG